MAQYVEKPRMIRVKADGTPYTGPTSTKQANDLVFNAGKAVLAAGGTKEAAEKEMATVGTKLKAEMREVGFMLIAQRVRTWYELRLP